MSKIVDQGTPLYDEVRAGDSKILAEVWSVTPWMVNIYTGRALDFRMLEMIDWCLEKYGREAWPIHDRPGAWQRGSSINGYSWWGFDDAEKLKTFEAAFPNHPTQSEEP